LRLVKRGYYSVEIVIDPKNEPEGAITEKQAGYGKANIAQAGVWLWSHKYWKKKREQSSNL
jgi:hypothetical protein